MEGKKLFLSGIQEANNGSSFWKVNGIGGKSRKHHLGKRLPEFLQDGRRMIDEALEVGPVSGLGVGCGVGIGAGVVGGVGFQGLSVWNHLKPVFGVGIGCGVGIGIGFGQGIGIGETMAWLRSRVSGPRTSKNKSKRPIFVQI